MFFQIGWFETCPLQNLSIMTQGIKFKQFLFLHDLWPFDFKMIQGNSLNSQNRDFQLKNRLDLQITLNIGLKVTLTDNILLPPTTKKTFVVTLFSIQAFPEPGAFKKNLKTENFNLNIRFGKKNKQLNLLPEILAVCPP